MNEYLAQLIRGKVVLDLGCRTGSFDAGLTDATVFRLDLAIPQRHVANFIAANAANLPFADNSVDLVVANHSLEHVIELDAVLLEIGRVIKPEVSLFVSVPDASTITDKLYRWLGRGGGHVNAIIDSIDFGALLASKTGLKLRSTKLLHSGFSFMNRKNCVRPPRRLVLLGGGFEWTLQILSYLSRVLDRVIGTRLSVYGWAFYFGNTPTETQIPWTNVCVRCGSAESSQALESHGKLSTCFLLRCYHCGRCETLNFFTPDLQ